MCTRIAVIESARMKEIFFFFSRFSSLLASALVPHLPALPPMLFEGMQRESFPFYETTYAYMRIDVCFTLRFLFRTYWFIVSEEKEFRNRKYFVIASCAFAPLSLALCSIMAYALPEFDRHAWLNEAFAQHCDL
uniref:Uncharacterized protein n=1 Tax=Glossina palpalis gambiensis TaxID=67801 RepID=A0A1B0AW42_9MUSC